MKHMSTNKWKACTTNPPGPIQVKRFNEALRELDNEHYTSTEKSGIIGKTEGIDAERSYSTVRFTICGSGDSNKKREDVTAAQLKLGEQFNWTVSRDNVVEATKAVLAAIPALTDARPVNDKRQTQEQADAEKSERIAKNQANQKLDDERNKAIRDTMEAAYGVPGRTVHMSPGEKAIVAVLCFDNSHYQSDYFDTHATIGVPLLIGATKSSREDEATARRAMERFPALAALKWEWKTEKYSMGHGNYLTSEGVDIVETVGALRRLSYGDGGPIKRGHWEIQFKHESRFEKDGFSVFAGFYEVPTQPEADERQNQGGALGTVKRNTEHDGVEIAFTDKPSDDLRYRMKSAGFRITRRPPWRWYKKYSDAAWKAACGFAGVTTEAPKIEQPDRFDMQVEDNMAAACGL